MIPALQMLKKMPTCTFLDMVWEKVRIFAFLKTVKT